jgi:hypothetical protein
MHGMAIRPILFDCIRGKLGNDCMRSFNEPDLIEGNTMARGEEAHDWMRIPPSLAHAYMMHLATIMGRRRQLVKVTDSMDSFAVTPFFDNDGHLSLGGYDEDAAYGHAVLGLSTIVPKRVADLSVDQLIRFRTQTNEGRRQFATQVERLAADLSKVEDADALHARLNDTIADFRRSRSEIVKQSHGTGDDFVSGAMCVGLSLGMGTMSLFAGSSGPFAPLPLVAGVVVAVVATAAQGFLQSRARIDPVRSYYLDMQNEVEAIFLTPHTRRGSSFHMVLEEYLND